MLGKPQSVSKTSIEQLRQFQAQTSVPRATNENELTVRPVMSSLSFEATSTSESKAEPNPDAQKEEKENQLIEENIYHFGCFAGQILRFFGAILEKDLALRIFIFYMIFIAIIVALKSWLIVTTILVTKFKKSTYYQSNMK